MDVSCASENCATLCRAADQGMNLRLVFQQHRNQEARILTGRARNDNASAGAQMKTFSHCPAPFATPDALGIAGADTSSEIRASRCPFAF